MDSADSEPEPRAAEAQTADVREPDGPEAENRPAGADLGPPGLSLANPGTFFGPRLDLRTVSTTGLFVLAFFYTLYFAKSLFLPIVVSVLLSFLLGPVVDALHARGLPKGMASALLVFVFLAVAGIGLHQALKPAKSWLAEAPKNLKSVERKLRDLLKPVEEVSEAARQVEELAKLPNADGKEAEPVEIDPSPSLRETVFDGTQDLIFGLGVVMVLTHLLLASGNRLLTKVLRLLPRTNNAQAMEVARRVQRDLSAHLLTVTAINFGLGAVVAAVTFFAGLPNPILWGVMAALLNFVPYLGAAVGAVILTVASLLTFDEVWTALLVPAAYLLATALEGTLVTPMLLGRRLALSPTVIFLALFFWGWIWGIPGALLAVPLLLSLKIICDSSEDLRPLGDLLG